MTDGYGIPPARVSTGANRHDSLLLAPTPDRLADLGPLPDAITLHAWQSAFHRLARCHGADH